MTAHDMSAEIAALLNPTPGPPDGEDDLPAGPAWEEREDAAESLRAAWTEGGIDPLLSTLTHLRQQRLRLEADMRLLIAYGRRFTHPRPYRLIDLAAAAGMSISGVRTAYGDDEVDQAAGILARPPSRAGDG